MAVAPGRYRLGPDNGRIVIRTFREGLGARAGHDLVIDVTRWSGELTVNDDKSPAAIEARIDMNSWIVREGNGGIKPLTDRDRREITTTARRVLSVQQHPEAEFTATQFTPAGDGGGTIDGTFTLAGSRPAAARAGQPGEPGSLPGDGDCRPVVPRHQALHRFLRGAEGARRRRLRGRSRGALTRGRTRMNSR